MKKKFIPVIFISLALLSFAACAKQAGSGKLPTPTPYVSPTPSDAKPTNPPAKPEFTGVDINKLPGAAVAGSDLTNISAFSFQPTDFFITKSGLLTAMKYEDVADVMECSRPPMASTLNLATGEVREYTLSFLPSADFHSEYSYYSYALYPLGDGYLLVNADLGDFYLLNSEFEKTDYFHEDVDLYLCVCPLDEDRIFVWDDSVTDYFTLSSGADGRLSIDRGRFSLPEDTVLLGVNQMDTAGHAIVIASDTLDEAINDTVMQIYTALYDFNTGELTRLPISDTTAAYALGDKILLWDYHDNTASIYSRAEPDLKKSFSIPEDSLLYSVSEDGTLLVTKADGGSAIYRYSYETGSLLSVLTIPESMGHCYFYNVSSFGKTIFFTTTDDAEDGKSNLFCGVAREAETASGFSALLHTVNYTEENDRLKSLIAAKYGIPVFTGGDAVHYNSEYFMIAEFDERAIYKALTALNETLASFPEGFFSELLADAHSFHSIEIYLTAGIRQNPNSDNTLVTAGGFVNTEGSVKTMTVDITDPGYKKTFAHEFMHIIDESMQEERLYSDTEYEALVRLDNMNPDGFEYFYSYRNYQKSKYADYCGSNYFEGDSATIPENIYFVDEYCLTYPGEDTARIFETLLFTPDYDIPAYLYSEPFQKKAAYVCACIRDSFDCITEDMELPWERFLTEKLPLDFFKEYFEIKPKG